MKTGIVMGVLGVVCGLSDGQVFQTITPPADYSLLRAEGLSYNGEVVAGVTLGDDMAHPIVGFFGPPQSVIGLNGPNDPTRTTIVALSGNAEYQVGHSFDFNSGTEQAFRRDSSGMYVNIPRLTAGHHFNNGLDVSADGRRVVGYSGSGSGSRERNEAFLWDEDRGLIPLGQLDPDPVITRALSISADGNTVVGFTNPTDLGRREGFVWTAATGMTRRYQVDGTPSYEIAGVSGDGRFVTGDSHRWDNGEPLYLGRLPGYESRVGFVNEMSDDGSVIIGNYDYSSPENPDRAYVWTEEGGIASWTPTSTPTGQRSRLVGNLPKYGLFQATAAPSRGGPGTRWASGACSSPPSPPPAPLPPSPSFPCSYPEGAGH